MYYLLIAPLILAFTACSNDQTEAQKQQTKPATSREAPVETSRPEPVKESNIQPAAAEQTTSLSGANLFKLKCASCHGLKAEKSALGKSEIIANWSNEQIIAALDGYQAGSYGKNMKALMQAQVKELSSEDIKILAHYITGVQ